jgi:hypothetical protein
MASRIQHALIKIHVPDALPNTTGIHLVMSRLGISAPERLKGRIVALVNEE